MTGVLLGFLFGILSRINHSPISFRTTLLITVAYEVAGLLVLSTASEIFLDLSSYEHGRNIGSLIAGGLGSLAITEKNISDMMLRSDRRRNTLLVIAAILSILGVHIGS
jgi:hypothetical protein